MARLNGVNTFDGGMLKDIHPIMVPNTVMTDCLNGTLITYNGNEFVLQNDMGNYAFNHGSLSNGFVPIGIKEHGGVLYIISYNPIDNKIEIGSFPSQKTIFNAITNEVNKKTIKSIELEKNKTYQKYTNLSTQSNLVLFSKEETFFLNPGDKYILQVSSGSIFEETLEELNKSLEWQHITPFILTNENKLYNIQGYIELTTATDTINRTDFKPTTWDIPGWLAVQFTINCMDEFSAYFDSKGTIAEFITDENDLHYGQYKVIPTGILKLQTFWNNNVYNTEIMKEMPKKLRFIFYNDIKDIDEGNKSKFEIVELTPEENQILDYNSAQDSIYHNEPEKYKNYNYVVPAMFLKDSGVYIIFDQFQTSISRDATYIDPNSIRIADEVYKYYTDTNSLTLTFDYAAGPGIKLKYQLERYLDPCTYTDGNYKNLYPDLIGTWQPVYSEEQVIDEINYNGQNVVDLTFTQKEEYNQYKYTNPNIVTDNPYKTFPIATKDVAIWDYNMQKKVTLSNNWVIANTFDKEDYYQITFQSYIETYQEDSGEKRIIETPIGNSVTKRLFASEVTNSFYYTTNNYDSTNDNDEYRVNYDNWSYNASKVLGLTFNSYYNDNSFNKIVITNENFTDTVLEDITTIPEDEWRKTSFSSTIYENFTESKLSIDNIKKYYGKHFANYTGYDTNYKGTSVVKDGRTFNILDLDNIKPKLINNQYNVVGRLWRGTDIAKIVRGNLLDRTGIVLPLKKNSKDTKFIIDLYNTYTLNLSSRSLRKSVVTKAKRMSEFMTDYTAGGCTYIPDSSDPIKNYCIQIRGGVQFWKNQQYRQGFEFKVYRSTDPNIYYRWENNIFKWSDKSNGTYSEKDMQYPWPANYIRNTTSIFKDDTKANANWVDSINKITYYLTSFKLVNFYIINNRFNGFCIKSDKFGDWIFVSEFPGDFGWAIIFPGNNYPIVVHPTGNVTDTVLSFEESFKAYSAIEWYVRVATNVATKTTYFPSVNLSVNNAPTYNITGCNIEAQLKYNYPMANTVNTKFNSNAINAAFNEYTVLTRENVNYNITLNLDDTVHIILQSWISDLTEIVGTNYENLSSQPDIAINSVYLLPEYNEEQNEVKLTKLVQALKYANGSIYMDDVNLTERIGIRASDNNTPRCAYETPFLLNE